MTSLAQGVSALRETPDACPLFFFYGERETCSVEGSCFQELFPLPKFFSLTTGVSGETSDVFVSILSGLGRPMRWWRP